MKGATKRKVTPKTQKNAAKKNKERKSAYVSAKVTLTVKERARKKAGKETPSKTLSAKIYELLKKYIK